MAREFHTKVAGVSHDNADGSCRQRIVKRCRPGQPLYLVREPDNEHDEFAVAVKTAGGEQLGYLNRELAFEVAQAMDAGTSFRAFVANVTGGMLQTKGCNILIQYADSAAPPERADDTHPRGKRRQSRRGRKEESAGGSRGKGSGCLGSLLFFAVIVWLLYSCYGK